jgi:hypothetical protein
MHEESVGNMLTWTPSMTHRNSGTRLMLLTAKLRMNQSPCRPQHATQTHANCGQSVLSSSVKGQAGCRQSG